MPISAVRHHDGQALIEQRKGVSVAFMNSETKILFEPLNGPVYDAQIGEPGILYQAQRHQPLNNHRVIQPFGQFLQSDFKGGSCMNFKASILPP